MKLSKSCEVCDKLFFYYDWHRPNAKFCSRACKQQQWSFWKDASKEEKISRLRARFDKKVIKGEGCWKWKGAIHHSGYTYFRTDKGSISGHRLSWQLHNGPIPKGSYICHNCPKGDNRWCTNPNHLFLGSPQDNIVDMVNKGTHRCARGEAHSQSKLTEDKVKDIHKYLRDGVKCVEIARKFDVSPSTIGRIKNGQWWRHIKK